MDFEFLIDTTVCCIYTVLVRVALKACHSPTLLLIMNSNIIN